MSIGMLWRHQGPFRDGDSGSDQAAMRKAHSRLRRLKQFLDTPFSSPRTGHTCTVQVAAKLRARLHTPASAGRASCSIRGVDPDVFCGEVAGPVTGFGGPGTQIHYDGDVLRKKTIAGGALVEVQRLTATQHGNSRHGDIHTSWIEGHARASRGSEHATPVGITTGKGGLN